MNGFILIVARNCLHLTAKAVNSALAQDVPCTILVINNASTDNTAQYLAGRKDIAHVNYIGQKSLAYCWNAGLKAAWALGYEQALVLNNDVEIQPWTYRNLWYPHQPFITCVSVDDRDQLELEKRPAEYSGRPHPDFSCFMISKSVTDEVGWFDEDCYPAFTEDCRYHVRMHRAGIRAVCIDLPFLHHGSSTIKHADPAERKAIQIGADRNRQTFRRLYGCLPGTKEYEALFDDATFGMSSGSAASNLPSRAAADADPGTR